MRLLSLLSLLLVLGSAAFAAQPAPAAAADALPQFRGLLAMGNERKFSLVAPGRIAPQWVELGATFDGWELADFKVADETLILKKDGRTVPLRLEGSSIADAPATAGSSNKATIADAEEVFRKMDFERMMTRMLDQMKANMAAMTRKMGPASPTENSEARAALQKKSMEIMFDAMDLPGMKNDMVKIYSEIFTKDELHALTDFYGTDAGKAMVDKQPEISQKMNELMMPRIAAAMPKIQAMQKEFAAEQAAKRAAAAAEAAAPKAKE